MEVAFTGREVEPAVTTLDEPPRFSRFLEKVEIEEPGRRKTPASRGQMILDADLESVRATGRGVGRRAVGGDLNEGRMGLLQHKIAERSRTGGARTGTESQGITTRPPLTSRHTGSNQQSEASPWLWMNASH
ncbi:hypothetical protein EAO77_31255 [Streptomyces sp. t39]|nr:hypothetical protein EAO77_31255 [Streptomyces sp. t39]